MDGRKIRESFRSKNIKERDHLEESTDGMITVQWIWTGTEQDSVAGFVYRVIKLKFQ
jgi:hypothetical protein